MRLACNSDALWACGIPCSLAQASTQHLGSLFFSFDLPLHRYFGEMWSCALGATGFGSAEVLNGKVNFVLLQRRGLTLLRQQKVRVVLAEHLRIIKVVHLSHSLSMLKVRHRRIPRLQQAQAPGVALGGMLCETVLAIIKAAYLVRSKRQSLQMLISSILSELILKIPLQIFINIIHRRLWIRWLQRPIGARLSFRATVPRALQYIIFKAILETLKALRYTKWLIYLKLIHVIQSTIIF